MIIETGSQNASRTPGLYAYPVRRYNQSSVEGVSAVQGKNFQIKQNRQIQNHLPQNPTSSDHISQELKLYGPASHKSTAAAGKSFSTGIHVNLLV